MLLLLRPASITVTEFHFLVLRGDRLLQVMSRLNGSLVQELQLRPADGASIGLVRDLFATSSWLYTSSSLFQVRHPFFNLPIIHNF